MRTSQAGIRSRTFGLSLIELLVAVSILGIATAVTVPAFSGAIKRAQQDAMARNLRNALREARRLAMAEQREVVWQLDTANGNYSFDEASTTLNMPTGSKLSLVTAQSEQINHSAGNIRFFPDGSSTGGEVRLSAGARIYVIRVDWLTGRVELN